MTSEFLRVEDRDGIRTITLDRPEAKNALLPEMQSQLCELLQEADRDAALKAVILTGTDPVFSAGVDFKNLPPDHDLYRAQFETNPCTVLRAMRTPVICAVNGACVSGALEIVLYSAFAVASVNARFADTHARLGGVANWGLSAVLPRAVGIRNAREMSITGNFVNASDALRMGIVNHVVEHENLMSFTHKLASDIVDHPVVGQLLSIYDRGQDIGISGSLALESSYSARQSFDQDDFAQRGSASTAAERTKS